MGVYGLETFLERNRPNAYCYDVNIKELADKFRSETGKVPEVLIDGSNCLRKLYDGSDDHWILGGQLKEFVETTKKLVTAFKNAGVRPHFCFVNAMPKGRLETWIERRNSNIKKVVEIFTMIQQSTDYSREYMLPPIVGAVGHLVPRLECNCDVTVVNEENHTEYIAKYAREHQSFAILSQDSAFVLMNGAKYYLSLKYLNLDTLTTITYSKEGLMEFLGLNHRELVHLAPLLSNKLFPLNKVNNFLENLGPRKNFEYLDIFEILPCVVKYIKERNIPNERDYQYLEKISLDICGTNEMANDLETCIRIFMLDSKKSPNEAPHNSMESDANWMKILQRANERNENCEITEYLNSLMLGDDYRLSVALENYSDVNLVPTARLYLPLRQRIYGVLFFEKPTVSYVKEWCIEGMECPTKSSEVEIKQIKGIETLHPGLLKLWSDNFPDDKRWQLFVEILTDKLKLDATKLKNLGFPFAVPVAVLFYVVKENGKLLSETEIDVILIQAAALQFYSADYIKAMRSQLRSSPVLTKRAVEISTIFTRGVAIVLLLLSACGFPLNKVSN
ncbi:hypothetical protein C0J52_03836 [Blattella germanica]|nr:hypothetical protein C0J52_03836 [Blattella germanica]